MKVGLISLGCPRNLVDSEIMLGLLKKNGFEITEDIPACDAAIVNTCSFIEDAKRESLDLIFQLIALKKEKRIRAIVVAGCLPQRYAGELKKELKDVDAFVGTADFTKIPEIVRRALNKERVLEVSAPPSFLADHTFPRDLITPGHFAYLKVAEGCMNNCSYCVIPKIRGPLRSRPIESLLTEAKALSNRPLTLTLSPKGRGNTISPSSLKGERAGVRGISEINLIGQDITLYGADLYGRPRLAELLRQLLKLKLAGWHRLLYTHPGHYTDELIDIVKNEPAVCKYLDLPLQHINDKILRSMNRKITKKEIIKLIERLRSRIPRLAIRTTFIVGFPGETDRDFRELYDFIMEARFERLGIFEYSREEGTPAYRFKGQVPAKIKKERFDAIMQLQQKISREVNAEYLGRELNVLIDEIDRAGTRPAPTYLGRTEHDAPEVDGSCFVRSKRLHKPGDFVKVKIVDTMEYDLVGEENDVIPAKLVPAEAGSGNPKK